MQQGTTRHASWRELLAAPAPASHIVQIYDSEDFLAACVAVFAAEGLRRGEAVLLTGTRAHLADVRVALAERGVDSESAIRAGQLWTLDVHEAMGAIVVRGVPDAARFAKAADRTLAKAGADGRFSGARWWGEISSVLRLQGDERAALRTEELTDEFAKERALTVLCSYCLDRFDATAYSGVLREVCAVHSHVIPAEDYVRHRLAVNRAIDEVIGEIKGPLLQSLLSWKGLACDLPSSQALLFWVRDTLPDQFQEVLSRVKAYQLPDALQC